VTGEQRYWQAIEKSKARGIAELKRFAAGEIGTVSNGEDDDRECLIEAFNEMQAEIDRCEAILRAAGLDGARGAALLPLKQSNSVF
jgi:hypothetical protein